MKNNKYLTIGELSKLTGIHIKSLRYYDRIGVLKPAYIDPDTSYRYYTYSQLGIIEVIRVCIELDIPLRRFAEYSEDEGNRVHYAKLIEHGKAVAEQKFRAIRDGLKSIEAMQEEIRRNDTFTPGDEPTVVDIPKKQYLLEPFRSLDTDDFHKTVAELYAKAAGQGVKPGYELGLLYIFRMSGEVERYQFIDVLSAPRGRAKGLTVLPAGQYLTRHMVNSQIETAPVLFPALFEKEQDLIVVELDLFTGEYNAAEALYELRCAVMPDGVDAVI